MQKRKGENNAYKNRIWKFWLSGGFTPVYAQEKNIESCTVRSEYWGAKLTPMKFTQKEVEDWIRLKEEEK